MPVANPPQITEPFGNSNSAANIIPVASQEGITPGAASFTDGFPPLCATPITAGGVPPDIDDMNGILKMTTAHIAFLASGAGYQYSSAVSTAIGGYNLGAMLLAADASGYWINTVANNTSNPDTGGANWIGVGQVGVGAVAITGTNASVGYTLTPAQFGKGVIYVTGSLSADTYVNFPQGQIQSWVVVNGTSGGHNLVCRVGTTGPTGATVADAGWPGAVTVQSDGATMYTASGSFVTSAQLSSALASYATQAYVTSTVSGYVAKNPGGAQTINGALNVAGTLSQNGSGVATLANLAGYLTTGAASSTYVSNASLASTLNSYLTTANAASTYVSSSLLSTTLSAYVTASSLSSTLANYATLSDLVPQSTIGANGVTKFPDGTIRRYGYVTGTGTSPQSFSFVAGFFAGFPTACTGVFFTGVIPAGGQDTFTLQSLPTKTGATVITQAGSSFLYEAWGY